MAANTLERPTGWGRIHRFDQRIETVDGSGARQSLEAPALYRGRGRSYGDVALNDGGTLVLTDRHCDLIAADWDTGVIRARSGMTLGDVLQIAIPKGWIPPVMPGTRYVSLGGMVANDVHGKNHHVQGSFGSCVRSIELERSDGTRLHLSRTENAELFGLTLGGLGLTGFIDTVEIALRPITSSRIDVENIPFADLDAFFDLTEDSDDWPYTVAWIDCLARGEALGRGIFTRGRHAETGALEAGRAEPKLSVPFNAPSGILNRATIGAFNALYRRRPGARFCGSMEYGPFFFPLDAIANWNRLYGRRGFYQHQSLLPPDASRDGLRAMLNAIASAGQGSFLAVLKRYGKEHSPGVMSFGGEGYSLALDFPNHGETTTTLLAKLEAIVIECGGRIYPAKDATMSEATFKAGYPRWSELEAARDPALSSSFWRRVVPESTPRRA